MRAGNERTRRADPRLGGEARLTLRMGQVHMPGGYYFATS
jgi:hypothetical protein